MTNSSVLEAARMVAVADIAKEDFQAEVDKVKAQLREHVPFWHRVFPWVITIKRRRDFK